MSIFVTNFNFMTSTRMQHRIDANLKATVEKILEKQGIRPAQAITIFYTEIKRTGGFPFLPTKVPNKKLQKTMADAKKGIDVTNYKNIKEMFKDLKKLK